MRSDSSQQRQNLRRSLKNSMGELDHSSDFQPYNIGPEAEDYGQETTALSGSLNLSKLAPQSQNNEEQINVEDLIRKQQEAIEKVKSTTALLNTLKKNKFQEQEAKIKNSLNHNSLSEAKIETAKKKPRIDLRASQKKKLKQLKELEMLKDNVLMLQSKIDNSYPDFTDRDISQGSPLKSPPSNKKNRVYKSVTKNYLSSNDGN